MAVVINGTTGITSVNGSASAPSVTGTDTDTGIVYGTNTLSLATGGTTAVTVNSSQNVGIGTSSPSYPVDVYSAAAGIVRVKGGSSSGQGGAFFVGAATSGSTLSAFGDWARINGGTVDQATAVYSVSSAPMLFAVGSERMRIDTSGNVGIGTSSPVAKLTAITTSGATAFATGSGNQNFYVSADTAARYVTLASSGDLAGGFKFNVGNSEVMRIDLSGKLLVGTTSAYEQLTVGGFCSLNNQQAVGGYASTLITNCNGGSYYGIMIKNASTSNSNAMTFINSSGSPNGSIAVTTTTTAYNTSSDYRLKENIQPMTGALAAVAQLKPCTYTWKETGEASQGFIAHELAEVVPQCVTGEKDAVNEDGSIKPQGIDTSFLVATLTAAIQEQQAIIEQLRADVAQLKGQA